MTSLQNVVDLPRRLSLTAQVADSLRKAIARRLWSDFLPSERKLCDLLQVSRPTIRAALRMLEQERLIEIRQGRRNRLLKLPAPAASPPRRLVALVSLEPLSRATFTAFRGITMMREQLSQHGFASTELICLGRSPVAQRNRLEAFLRQNRVFCCVLLSVSRELQLWFATHSIPCLVLGSCHHGVRLPSLDVDHQAVCRHAAGVFRRHGHRRMALIVPDSGFAGDLASETGFQEGAGGTGAIIVRHRGSHAQLESKLEALFADARGPTALLVARPGHTLSVLAFLLRRGIRVPGAVSLIARDHDPLYSHELAHYAFGDQAFARRFSRLLLQMVSHGHLPAEPQLIFPRFVAGDSVRDVCV